MRNHLAHRLSKLPALQLLSPIWKDRKRFFEFNIGHDTYIAKTPADIDCCLIKAIGASGHTLKGISSTEEVLQIVLFLAGIYVESIGILPFHIKNAGIYFKSKLRDYEYSVLALKNMITPPMGDWLRDEYRVDFSKPNIFFSLTEDGLLTSKAIPSAWDLKK